MIGKESLWRTCPRARKRSSSAAGWLVCPWPAIWPGVVPLTLFFLERHQLTSGTSWHAAGIIGPLRASMNLTRLSVYAIETFARLERETGQSTGYCQTGGFWLAQTPERMTELRRIADIGAIVGLDACMVEPDQIRDTYPLLETADLAGGLWVKEDGQANPVDVCMAYAKAARNGGVRIFENVPVHTVRTKNVAVQGVELADGHTISCKRVVNCAGAWAHVLGSRSGVAIPLQAVEHMYVVTEPVVDLPRPTPVVRDLDGRIYIKEDAGRLVLGGFEANAKALDVAAPEIDVPFLELPEDWEQFEDFMKAGLKRVPALNDCGIQHFMNGPESFTPDTKQLLGEAPECRNYFVAAGFNSIGIISSAGAGRVMADWIVDGLPPMDVVDLDIARFETDMASTSFLKARVREAVASQFEMHWPFKRMQSGRDLRHLPAHDLWCEVGAVFGAPGGWERPLWFREEGDPDDLGYSYVDQPWWRAAERECQAARDAAVLIDFSPFSKFQVSGPTALADLQRMCTANIDIPLDRAVYTLLLNERGGIQAEVTVTRRGEQHFMVIGAAPSRRRDFAWLVRNISPESIVDQSRDIAVLGLMGSKALDVWRAAEGDVRAADLGFGASRECGLGPFRIGAQRLSYIGEPGWEIYCPPEQAHAIAAHILEAGAPLGLRPMGLYAVEACRHEKAFRHWGHDIGPEDTPLEAGLGFAVAWSKPDAFIGHRALESQRSEGVRRRVLQFAVADAHPLLLHDEPVYRDGVLVGQTTSGARGFRTGRSLCFANVTVAEGETIKNIAQSRFEICVASERYRLDPLARPLYDPDGVRMRGPMESQTA